MEISKTIICTRHEEPLHRIVTDVLDEIGVKYELRRKDLYATDADASSVLEANEIREVP